MLTESDYLKLSIVPTTSLQPINRFVVELDARTHHQHHWLQRFENYKDYSIQDIVKSAEIMFATEQCPICLKLRKSFHCETCVGIGNFGHSSVTTENGMFMKKQMAYQNVVHISNSLKKMCADMVSEKQSVSLKKIDILMLQENVRFYKLAISYKNTTINDKINHLKKLKSEIDDQKSRIDRYRNRVVNMGDFTKCQKSDLNDRINTLFEIRPILKNAIQTQVSELVTNIFPVNKVDSTTIQNEELDVHNSLSHALDEASKITYVLGQSETALYRIVAPTLPENGNYSEYNEWLLNKNKNYHQSFSELNPAYSISAALDYTSQLVKQLSIILNVILPRHTSFCQLYNNEMDKTKFSNHVIHLNANILYLCFSQNVDPKLLHSEHTLKNVLQLLNISVSDLGRFEPSNIDYKLCTKLEKQIACQLLSSCSDSDSEDDNFFDWETVPKIENQTNHSQSSSQSTSSTVNAGRISSTISNILSMCRELIE